MFVHTSEFESAYDIVLRTSEVIGCPTEGLELSAINSQYISDSFQSVSEISDLLMTVVITAVLVLEAHTVKPRWYDHSLYEFRGDKNFSLVAAKGHWPAL